MSTFVIGCALGALIAACISAPFLLPWPMRVHYLVAAPMTDPWTGLGLAPRLDMRAVKLRAVESHHGDLELALDDLDTGQSSRVTIANSACVPSVVSKLDGWMALRTTLLMIMDHGDAHLYGPDGAVTNLNLAREKIQ